MKRHGSMNHIFRLVWSHVLQSWVAVAENTRGQGKGKSSRRKLIAAALALTAVTTVIPEAMAGPAGGKVVAGSATINQKGSTTTIDQTSQDVTLNWNSFNIAPQETVDFVQPSSSSLAVNYILGNNGTQILGHLNANGQVYLINPNGILFGQGSQVNVGGLVASTLNLVNDNAGLNTVGFSGIGSGSIVNQGTITAKQGGYVALVGNTVNNHGTVTAQLGSVALGAGSAVTLTFNGNNLVHLQVDKSTLDNLAANGGLIKADGGLVVMSAGAKNALLASVVNNTGVIEAQTVSSHDGTIELMGSMQAGTVQVGGTLDASAPNGGHGGNVTTDAANVIVANNAKISTAATQGASGLWTIDPTNFTITPDSSALTASGMGNATLVTALNSGSVSIATSSAANGTDLGDINVNAPVIWSNANSLTLTALNNINVNAAINWGGNGSSALTLNAQNNININSAMSGATGASLALQFGQSSVSGAGSSYNINAPVNLPSGNNYSTQQGSTGTPIVYTVINSLGAAADATGGALTLQGIAASANLSGNFALGSNIDATATNGWHVTGGFGFTPIGSVVTNFSGNFDGLGHTISNLTINTPEDSFVGLFGYTNGAMIQNVGLINDKVFGLADVGGLVGSVSNGGIISNSYASGTVTGGSADVGGLLGYVYDGTVSNSNATGTVTGSASSESMGGLVGFAYGGGIISNSHATGAVIGGANSYYIGGLVGQTHSVTVTNSYATGAVSGGTSSTGMGGLVGLAGIGTISNSYATGSVTTGSNSSSVGGLVGVNFATITNVYSVGSVTSSGSEIGGLIGNNTGAVTDGYWNTQTSGQNSSAGGTGLTTAQMQTVSNFTGFNFSTIAGAAGNNWVMVDADGTLNNAGGVSGGTYPMLTSEYSTIISNAHQLQLIMMAPSASYTLANNFTAINTGTPGSDVWNTSEGFVPIGNSASPFTGTLNGYDYTISNLTINAPTSSFIGLFGYINSATIQNVGLVNVNITGLNCVGGLVGASEGGTITNSYATGSVSSSANSYDIGGLVGAANGGSVINSYSTASVTGGASSGQVGGLVGYAYDRVTISNSYATGSVTGGSNADYIGGLVGFAYGGTITNGYATGPVSGGAGSSFIGGLIGVAYEAMISDSHATGPVSGGSGSLVLGGLVGTAYEGTITNSYATGSVTGSANSSDIGGLVGYANQGTTTNSYATGSVTGSANSSNIGGLVGDGNQGVISNSYATGSVTGSTNSTNIGGLVGSNSATITNVYSVGGVTSSGSEIGGLVGYNVGTVTNGYWNSTVFSGAGVNNEGGSSTGAGLTATQMQTAANFAGFNFSTTPGAAGNNWVMEDVDGALNNAGGALGATYPMLSSEYSTTISNAHQLQLISMAPSANYTLANNINAFNTGTSGLDVWSTSMGFVPIGNASFPFTGTLNGSGFAISNLTINAPANNYVGLFGVTNGATIQNVGLVNGNITGSSYVGGLVGASYAGTTISNSYVTGAVNGSGSSTSIGGLVGSASGTTISNSYATGAVTGGVSGNMIGGLVGFANGGTIINSYATGPVNGGAYSSVIGGLMGLAYNETISNSYATGPVTGGTGSGVIGGLVGYDYRGTLSNSYATGLVTGSASSGDIGGLVGYSYGGNITNVYSVGNVTGSSSSIGGLVGNNTGTVINGYWNSTIFSGAGVNNISGGSSTVTGLSNTQMQTASNFTGFNFSATPGAAGNNWVMVDTDGALNNASGALGATYPMLASEYATTISNTHQLQLITMAPSASYTLVNNINAVSTGTSGLDVWSTSMGFVPIGNQSTPFTGTLNGSSYTISNLTINAPRINNVGLFGSTNEATIQNVGLLDGNTSGFNNVGGLVGQANGGSITNSYAGGFVAGVYDVGGLVGLNSGTIENSYAAGTGTVKGSIEVGGLVGANIGTISDSYAATGNVSSTVGSVGGLIGSNTGTVNASFWNTTTTNQTISAGGTGLSTAQMMTMSNFYNADWNITNAGGGGSVWRIYDGSTMPLLDSFLAPLTITADNIAATYSGTTPTPQNVIYSIADAGSSGHVLGLGYGNATNASAIPYSLTAYSDQQGYDITINGGSLSINPEAITVSTGNVTKTYDGTTTAVGVPVIVSGSLYNSDTLSGGTYAFANANAGNGNKTVIVAGVAVTDSGNYTITDANNTTSTINPEPITVSSSNVIKTYDGTTTAIGAPVITSGTLYNGDTLSGGTYVFTDANAGTANKTVTVAGVAVTVADSGNYSITDASNTTSTINPEAITVSTSNVTKTYDGTTTANGSATLISGTLYANVSNGNAQDVLSGGSFAYTDANAGTGKSVTVNSVVVNDGNNGNNYAISYVNNTASVINAEPITVSTSNVTKTYDGTTTANGSATLISGSLYANVSNGNAQDVLSGGSFAYTDANAGTGKSVTVNSVVVNDGNNGNNYAISYVNNTASVINAEPIAVSTGNVTKTYDGTTTAVGAPVVVSGNLYNSDTLSGGTYAFINTNAGSGNKTVTVAGIAVTDSSNYIVTDTNNTTSTINPEPITVSTSNVTKTYDGTTTAIGAPVVTSGMLYNGDTISGGTYAFADANAGNASKTVTVAGVAITVADSANYTVTDASNTTSTITPAPLAVTANNEIKIFGAPVPTLSYTQTGTLYGSDTLSSVLSGTLSSSPGVNAGTYSINQGTLVSIDPNYSLTFNAGKLTIEPLVEPSAQTSGQTSPTPVLSEITPVAQLPVAYLDTAANKPVDQHIAVQDGKLAITVVDGGVRMPTNIMALQ